MLIRKPVVEVFEAFVDPALSSRLWFWFTRGSGRLQQGAQVIWRWDPCAASAQVAVSIEEGKAIHVAG